MTDRILALPSDEVVDDIHNIVMYEIGRTYRSINDGTLDEPESGAIMHSLLFLTQLGNSRALDTIFEILRQNERFVEAHLGDLRDECLIEALYFCGQQDVQPIAEFMYVPGLYNFNRSYAVDTLMQIALNYSKRRAEIIEIFRRLLVSMVSRLPNRDACDGTFAALLIEDLIDLQAKELIPEIRALYATGCVRSTISGDEEQTVSAILSGDSDPDELPSRYNIHSKYTKIKRLCVP